MTNQNPDKDAGHHASGVNLTEKELALTAIRSLDADASLDDIRNRIDLLLALRGAEQDVERGELVPHEQVAAEFTSWVTASRTKSSGPSDRSEL